MDMDVLPIYIYIMYKDKQMTNTQQRVNINAIS